MRPKPHIVSVASTETLRQIAKDCELSVADKRKHRALIDTTTTDTASVEKYEFEPIKGYPMLNWRGKRPFTTTQYYPAQLKEVHGEEVEGWRNKIYWGDNLQVMSHLLKEFRGKVDLIYIDPPFDSKAEYKKKIKLKGKKYEGGTSTFEEKQYTDIWTNDEYLQFMYERLVLCRELLSDRGTIVLHADCTKSHHLRCLLDEVFGEKNFLNEVIWDYRRWPTPAAEYQKMHDNLMLYTRKKGENIFNRQYMERTESTEKRWKGKAIVAAHNDEGDRIPSDYNAEDSLGSPLNDVWYVPIVAPSGHERSGYPTQKPEALLEKFVAGNSDPGSLVFDCFMGSGTTQAVAMKLGRRFIGADINLGAIQSTTKRLIETAEGLKQSPLDTSIKRFTGFEVYNVNHYDVFRNPVEAKDLLLEALEVQKLEMSSVFDGEKNGRMVKIMPVTRITTRADLNELIAGFDYKAWERRQAKSPNRPVEKITLVCMGHEPDLASQLERATKPFKVDVEVVDILRDNADLEFKRDSQAKVSVKKGELVIEKFYPMNLLQKLSQQKEAVEDWKELVESVLIDWNYDDAVLQPAVADIPGNNELVKGTYKVPVDAGNIRVKITDLLSESWEGSVNLG
jgi:DNA modification methylase